ncbi:MAG: GTPase Era [Candidatus Omnitrophica bacterium]|nr:GTPase Era [Candidatus Omnitrophota bacterium]
MTYRSGFVGIVGRPNVGKSTILNYYLGEKIAIVSSKPQTTRQRILGVLTRPEAQVLFLDSPGLHKPEHVLGRYMVEVAKSVLEEADVIVAVIDGRVSLRPEDERVFDQTRQALEQRASSRQHRSALLAINKVDAVKKPKLLPLLKACAQQRLFDDCIPISALTGEQMPVLLDAIIAHLPEGPRWYDPEHHTDQPASFRISELIREQVLIATHQEVPHAVGVIVDQIEERPRVLAIHATILVERDGQKAIVIGREGAMMKQIGSAARQQIERLLGKKVHLGLWVKVAENWRDNERVLRQLGLFRYVSEGKDVTIQDHGNPE